MLSHTQIPTRAAIRARTRTMMTNTGSKLRTLRVSKRVVTAVTAIVAAIAVLGLAYCIHTHYEQWSKGCYSIFRELRHSSARIGSTLAINHGLKKLEHITGLTSIQVCVYLHLITVCVIA
jgi:hypothetical protein